MQEYKFEITTHAPEGHVAKYVERIVYADSPQDALRLVKTEGFAFGAYAINQIIQDKDGKDILYRHFTRDTDMKHIKHKHNKTPW